MDVTTGRDKTSRSRRAIVTHVIGRLSLALVVAVAATGSLDGQQAAKAVLSSPPLDRALLDRYCVTCHNQRARTAGLMLDQLDLEQVAANASLLEKVVMKLRAGQMPPAGQPRPEPIVLQEFVTSLERALDRVAATSPDPGRVAVHRLNRFEYVSAIEDLLGLVVDPALLPPDSLGVGFDNNGQVLSITPALMNRYLSAATKIIRQALGDPAIPVSLAVYKASPHAEQTVRTSEDLPFGTKGGLAVRHYFPLDGAYVLKVRLQRNSFSDTIRGIDDESEIQVNIDHEPVTRFTVGGKYPGFDPAMNTALPEDDVEGNERHGYRLTADEHMDFRLAVKAGSRLVSAAFTDRKPMVPERVPMAPMSIKDRISNDDAGDPGVDRIEIMGPYAPKAIADTPSRRRILVCRPPNENVAPCARTVLTRLARRAYRRPVGEVDVHELMGLFGKGNRQSGFEAGIRLALEALLSSPSFLFKVERDPAHATLGTAYGVTDVELASRLSFALWKSIPDEELLAAGVQGRLRDPIVRAQQTRRMLADPKATRWIDDFMEQWLGVRSLQAHEPTPTLFPEFDDSLRDAMMTETQLFFQSQIREDRSVVDLLRADYTFLNEQLAQHYGVPGVYGPHFRRVTITSSRRQGLLGHGSILTTTSYADRTSVVLRGKWVLSTLLGSPPPPPPNDVPPLEENRTGAPRKSLRERMEQHRKNPVCAGCHALMDPMGFVLENFDATGHWRDDDSGAPIDSVATTPAGAEVAGPPGLRAHLLDRRDEVIGTLTARLLEYFLGRSLEYYDRPAVRQIIRDAAAADYRWSALVLGIVESVPFQMRRAARSDEVSLQAAVENRR